MRRGVAVDAAAAAGDADVDADVDVVGDEAVEASPALLSQRRRSMQKWTPT